MQHMHGEVVDAAAGRSLMGRLRVETRELHEAAEQHPFQQSLVHGDATREDFVRLLQEMRFVHEAIEGMLRRQAASVPAIAAVMRDEGYRTGHIDDDLGYFGVTRESSPTESTRRLIQAMESVSDNSPTALLGFHYVLEGSKNGSKFIAKHLRRALGLSDGRGLLYLDPEGDRQPANWQAFKKDMDGFPFSEAEMDGIVHAAKEMFRAIAAIYEELEAVSTRARANA